MLFLCAEEGGMPPWVNWVFVGVLVVLVAALLIVPMFTNKKRAKQESERYNSLRPGDVIKTVGGIIGTVIEIRQVSPTEKELVIETGVGDNKTTMVFDIQALYPYDSGVQAFVRFSGARIPLFRFDGASPHQPTRDTSGRLPVMSGEEHWRLMYPSVAASGHVLKSTSPYSFERAFVARMGTGHTGIFERTGGMTSRGKDEIEELFGPSVPQMLGSEDVEKALAEDAMKSFEKDLDHDVLAILSGYMR